jgi:hypothetical protein
MNIETVMPAWPLESAFRSVEPCLSSAEFSAKCRIAGRRLLGHTVTHDGDGSYQDACFARYQSAGDRAAQRQWLTESVWLRRVVDAALRSAPVSEDALIHRAGIGPSPEGPGFGPRSAEHGSASAFGTVTD